MSLFHLEHVLTHPPHPIQAHPAGPISGVCALRKSSCTTAPRKSIRRDHSIEAQRSWLVRLGSSLGLPDTASIAQVASSTIRENGGSWILRLHQDSPSKMIACLFPELQTSARPWMLVQNRKKLWWREPGKQREFADWAALELGVHLPQDWLKFSLRDLQSLGGSWIMREYGGSLSNFLNAVYPEHSWLTEPGDNVEQHRAIFNNALAHMGATLSDLYAKTLVDISGEEQLKSLVRQSYGCSLSRAAVAVFPEHPWDIGAFLELPKDPEARLNMLSRYVKTTLSERLNITQLDDWYRISRHDFRKVAAKRFKEFETQASIFFLISQVFPEHTWDQDRFVHARAFRKRSSQRLLRSTIRSILPSFEVLEDYYHPTANLRFDVFIPKLNLALEYHGEQHFQDIAHVGVKDASEKWDANKAAVCAKAGISLVEIPYNSPMTLTRIKKLIQPFLPLSP